MCPFYRSCKVPVFGARPLKRFLQRHLETRLARALISGEVGEDTAVSSR